MTPANPLGTCSRSPRRIADGQAVAAVLCGPMPRNLRLLLVAALAAIVSACTTTPAGSLRPAAANPLEALAKGMTGDEVKAAWGAPLEIRPFKDDADNARVWVYQRNLRTNQTPVAATLQEVPFYDPISGEYRPFKEPYFNEQITTTTQVVELIMVDDRLTGWRRSLSEQRTFR